MSRTVAFICLVSIALISQVRGQSKMIILLRVDDVLSRNTTILPRSIVPFEQAAESRGAKVTWVTIPHRLIESNNTDGSLARELRASVLKGHEVAQHGYNHICQKCGQTGHEFYCTAQNAAFSLTDQSTMVDDGLRILADSLDVHPSTFVSPGHSEDATTYQALAGRGFKYISTNKVTTKQYAAVGVFNLAHHAEYTWAMTSGNYRSQLTAALSAVRSQGERDGYYAFLFHDYFIRSGYEGGIVVQWLGEVLDSLQRQYGDRLEFLTLSQAAARFETSATSVTNEVSLPLTVELGRNYPNPFNPLTIIDFRLSISGTMRLSVFDLLGREVAVLVDEEKPAGKYQVLWNAEGMASGVYVCQLRAGSQAQKVKMLLLR